MTVTSKPILFFGNERLATGVSTTAPTLRALIAAGYEVCAVVSSFEPGQSRSARQLEIAEVAAAHDIPVLLPADLKAASDQLRSYGAEAAVLVAYGKIVPQEILDIFPKGIINIHPSLLPLHRGPTPIESVILDGSSKTGVSIMQLVKAMDAGPVYKQAEVELDGTETKQALSQRLLDLGGQMLLEVLPGILSGEAHTRPQDDAQATYDELIGKADGVLDWNKPAQRLEREVRAYGGWPKSRTSLAGLEVVVTKARVAAGNGTPGQVFVTDTKELAVQTTDGALIIESLIPAGKKEMPGRAFLAGYGKNLS